MKTGDHYWYPPLYPDYFMLPENGLPEEGRDSFRMIPAHGKSRGVDDIADKSFSNRDSDPSQRCGIKP